MNISKLVMLIKKNLLEIYKRNNQQVLKLTKILMKNDIDFKKEDTSCSEIVMNFFKVVIEKNFGRKKMG
jgi:hypothetical protein